MNERIKELRCALGLTLEQFGKPLGVSKAAISNIENGHRNVSSQLSKSICREFNVNPQWLATGDGDMFQAIGGTVIGLINNILCGENQTHIKLVKWVATLNENDITAIEKLIDRFTHID